MTDNNMHPRNDRASDAVETFIYRFRWAILAWILAVWANFLFRAAQASGILPKLLPWIR